jgi:hypothetical protein
LTFECEEPKNDEKMMSKFIFTFSISTKKTMVMSRPAFLFLIFDILRKVGGQRLLVGLQQPQGPLRRHLQDGAQLASEYVEAGQVLKPDQARAIDKSAFHDGS